ncbi:PQQ-binding-like beta-propeller repeat protein [Kitasatospora sp. NPDC089797]|uniref:outer membrane protein assembly factor BamB family protein n=1 Tax=Kitasatospora sp. NPDC089797 TaxID=3155298 RepID=UPI003434A241
MKSSDGSVRDASWQWDGEADGTAEAPADVLGGGRDEDGSGWRPSRRGLLVGTGVLAAGGAAWALGRAGGDPMPPGPAEPKPTALSGPTPLWTYRGPQPMTLGRMVSLPQRPVFLSKAGLQVLDPATGDPRRLVAFDPPRPRDLPADIELPLTAVLFGPDQFFTAASKGHLDAHHLTDPAADWSLPLPEEPPGQLQLAGLDDGILYGSVRGWPGPDGSGPANRIHALRVADRSLLWSVELPADRPERPVAPATRGGDLRLLPCVRSVGAGTELVARDAATGREQWTAPGRGDLRWCVADGPDLLVPDGNGGVLLLGPDGRPGWSHSPARGESWQAMRPVPAGPKVFVPRGDGVVSCLDTTTGAVLWSRRLPFLLDSRSRPLFLERTDTLYVPGPASAGVCALRAATGRPAWTFRDSGPGRDVWTVSTDGTQLYAGHDDVLHALPPD